MDKEDLVKYLRADIERMQTAIEQAGQLEQGKIYELDNHYDVPVLGIVRGFSYGPMSAGVRIEVLGAKAYWNRKTATLSLYGDLKIKPVSYTDFPKYIGWGMLQDSFVKRLKDIDKYIKREEKATNLL